MDFQDLAQEAIFSTAPIQKRAITNLGVLNEAYEYDKPSTFSRGMKIDIGSVVILLISGTASIDETGKTVHVGDFRAQCRRTFHNLTLASEGATWHDVVRTSAISATLTVTMQTSTRSGLRSIASSSLILSLLRPVFRLNCVDRTYWLKSKPS